MPSESAAYRRTKPKERLRHPLGGAEELTGNHKELRIIFKVLLKFCYDNQDGFGENPAIDGKAIPSFARRKGTEKAPR